MVEEHLFAINKKRESKNRGGGEETGSRVCGSVKKRRSKTRFHLYGEAEQAGRTKRYEKTGLGITTPEVRILGNHNQ